MVNNGAVNTGIQIYVKGPTFKSFIFIGLREKGLGERRERERENVNLLFCLCICWFVVVCALTQRSNPHIRVML